jgi:hypothetical protein
VIANTVAAIAAVAAVVASLVTVRRAGQTILEAREARRESQAAHTEEIAELQKVREATVVELRAVAAASSAAHRDEMEERKRAFEADLVLRRVIQMQAAANVITRLIDAARADHLDQPPPLGEGLPFRATRIPALQAHLRVALRALESLRGPKLPLTDQLLQARAQFPMEVVGAGTSALAEIDQLLGGDPLLQLPAPSEPEN